MKKELNKKLYCYICSKRIDKKKNHNEVDIIVKATIEDSGIVIQTRIHKECMEEFYQRFLNICGKGAEKCDSVKKPKKPSTVMKRK